MKVCSECDTQKELADFYTRSSRCKPCHREYTRQHYLDNKQEYLDKAKAAKNRQLNWYKALKEQPCTDCKNQYPHYVMQFDHLRDKDFNISSMVFVLGKDRLLEEIAKCELVCANCHTERTWRRAH